MTFTPNIPQSGQSLGQTRDAIRNNFSNYNTVVSVDHVAPNAAGQGEHQQVTFNAVHVPAAGTTTPPILFTNIQDGAGNALPGSLAQLFYYTGLDAKSRDQYVSQAAGSCLLFGGIILKWGTGALTAAQTTFPVAFPNNCFCVTITGSSTLYTGGFVSTSLSAAGFTASRTSGSGNTGFYYIAIGN